MSIVVKRSGKVAPWHPGVVRGTCPVCACKFEAMVSDCTRKVIGDDGGRTKCPRQEYRCSCPECGILVCMEKAT